MHFPTWVDLKGQDSVPETVHHVVSCPYSQSWNSGHAQHTIALPLLCTPVIVFSVVCD